MIFVQLAGGLGNQLFQYYLGQYLQIEKGAKVGYFNTSLNKSHHGSSIKDFFPNEFYTENKTYASLKTRIISRISKTNDFLDNFTIPMRHDYSSRKNGIDSSVLRVSKKANIYGYFQTYFYFRFCMANGLTPPLLLNQSAWLRENLQIFQDQQPAAIHLRFGDYSLHNETIGNLSKAYYIKALENMMERKNFNHIYCFSDNLAKSSDWLSESKYYKKIQFINPPVNAPASESLILQSKAAGHVISNSTFSWWAATLSSQECVISPKKWFIGMKDPETLLPPNWNLQESTWVRK